MDKRPLETQDIVDVVFFVVFAFCALFAAISIMSLSLSADDLEKGITEEITCLYTSQYNASRSKDDCSNPHPVDTSSVSFHMVCTAIGGFLVALWEINRLRGLVTGKGMTTSVTDFSGKKIKTKNFDDFADADEMSSSSADSADVVASLESLEDFSDN
jgi:hypothetical protein